MTTMATTYRIRDNGKRSFIPPTFCWDLVLPSGEIADVVSEIDFAAVRNEHDEEALRGRLTEGTLRVSGHIVDTEPPPDGISRGKKLIVSDVRD